MWLALRELPTEHRFRRQHPIGSYVVEIASRGYRVIRFWNNGVMHNLTGVLEVIRRELECPLCPPGGEGGDPSLRRRGG
jgi:very-short-patch-repair endonuclease